MAKRQATAEVEVPVKRPEEFFQPRRWDRIRLDIEDRPYADVDDKKMLDLYYYMRLSRRVEEQVIRLYRQGKIVGGVFTGSGNEAITVGSTYALEDRDALFPIHRDTGAHFVKGQSVKTFLANYLGRANTPSRGRDGNLHLGYPEKRIYGTISHLAAMIPVAAGFALGARMRGKDDVALTFIGEGGTSLGDFHEALNFAAVHKLALIVVIENNQFAYSTPTRLQYACEYLADRAIGYGIHGEVVYGNNVLAVYETVKKAVDRARKGEGPTLIEAITMRMRGHSEHDDYYSYVPKSMLEEWAKRDPIKSYEKYLLEKGVLTPEKIEQISQKIEKEVEEATEYALSLPFPEPEDCEKDLFAE
jgi:TPP-dependent pyruvate/acetoin dehydrogenase alpha subunit